MSKGAGKGAKPVVVYEIEPGWVIVPEERDFAVARCYGDRKDGRGKQLRFLTFHATVAQALKSYAEMRLLEAASNGMGGSIKDLVDILVIEQRKTQALYEKLYRQMEVLK